VEVLFGGAGVGGGVGHDAAGAAFGIECGAEEVNPEVVDFDPTPSPAVTLRRSWFRVCARCRRAFGTSQAGAEGAAQRGRAFQPRVVSRFTQVLRPGFAGTTWDYEHRSAQDSADGRIERRVGLGEADSATLSPSPPPSRCAGVA